MNSNTIDIRQARELLNLWYQGKTTPEQEGLLYDFFSSSDALPDDLKPEAVIFGHTSDGAVSEIPPIDPALLSEIDQAITIEKTKLAKTTKSNRFKHLAWFSSSIAVAATVALFIIFNAPTEDSKLITGTIRQHSIAVVASPQTANSSLDDANTSTTKTDTISVSTIPVNTNVKIAKSAPHKKNTKTHTPNLDNGYKIVDSPDEALTILQQSFAYITHSIDRSYNSINTTTEGISNSLEKISQITNSISSNI